MAQIQAVGFDLDYTLAEYKIAFDLLAYDGAVRKLIAMGYPKEVASFKYDPKRYQRGLLIDKQRGNVLKLDRHKYVKVAYHGLSKLESAERKAIYARSFEAQPTFSPPEYASIDTDFLLVDVCLFCQLVDLKDRFPEQLLQSYATIYQQVRRAVDLCHCDGEIKDPVAVEPAKYIYESPELAAMLSQLKLGGKQVFLLTNSLYDYTKVVLEFLLGPHWLNYFDLVICGARKPGFLLDPYLPIFRVNTADASLQNIEMGSEALAQRALSEGKVFQGGNWNHLHRMLRLQTGSALMYVGDHMYSDILRSKRTLGWRTVLMVPELCHEVSMLERSEGERRETQRLRQARAGLDLLLRRLQLRRIEVLASAEATNAAAAAAAKAAAAAAAVDQDKEAAAMAAEMAAATAAEAATLAELEAEEDRLYDQQSKLTEQLVKALEARHESFHPYWGQLFKAGHQNSRWAQQVGDYACLYTSHAVNLRYATSNTSFRALADLMPHDRACIEAALEEDGGAIDMEAAYSQD